MPSKQQKREVIRKLLLPVFLIIAAILYRPAMNFFGLGQTQATLTGAPADGKALSVYYLDVGQGDATLITKGDFCMLIDAGKNSEAADYLEKLGIDKLDVLVGTHPDNDHIGGLDEVLRSVEVDTVYMSQTDKDTKTCRDVKSAVKHAGKELEMPEIGKEYTYEDNVVFRFLSPRRQYPDSNNNSLVLQLAYGKTRFLFMGDAEEEVEEELLQEGADLSCDVLKLGHHGSYTATSPAFLQKADPVYGVISCGKGNSYGHPHAEVMARLEDEDVQVYRTDTMGTVQAVSDGENVKLSTEGGKQQ